MCTRAPPSNSIQEVDDSDMDSEDDYSTSSDDACSETEYSDEDELGSMDREMSSSSTSSEQHDDVSAANNHLATLLNDCDDILYAVSCSDDCGGQSQDYSAPTNPTQAVQASTASTCSPTTTNSITTTSSSSGNSEKLINPLFEKIPTFPSFVSQTSSLTAAAAASSRPVSFIHPLQRQQTLLASSCKLIKRHQSALSSALRSAVISNSCTGMEEAGNASSLTTTFLSSSTSLVRPNPIFARPCSGFPVGPHTLQPAAVVVVPDNNIVGDFADRELSESLKRNLAAERRRMPYGMCLNGEQQRERASAAYGFDECW